MVGGYVSLALLLSALFIQSHCEIYFNSNFQNAETLNEWKKSRKNTDSLGELEISSILDDPNSQNNKFIHTKDESKFYHYVVPLVKPITNGDDTLVFQYALHTPKPSGCGGAYLKLLPTDSHDDFDGNSKYNIMFGPDVCGSKRLIHLIFNVEGKNIDKKSEISYQADDKIHMYTMVVRPNKTYEVFVDCVSVSSGSISDDWNFQPPKMIEDPSDVKPKDWVEEETIDDPSDTKPDDWDQPEYIEDLLAEKPDGWDEETDGEYKPPMKKNPDFKGQWEPKKIPNPAYKGEWKPKQIPNPNYHEIIEYAQYTTKAIGMDLWRHEGDVFYRHILVSNDESDALLKCKEAMDSDFKPYNDMIDAKKAEAASKEADPATPVAPEEEYIDEEDESVSDNDGVVKDEL